MLLDTQALIWWLAADPRMPPLLYSAIDGARTDVVLSAATAWEISIKRSLGKLDSPDDLFDQTDAALFRWLDVSKEVAYAAGQLPRHHADPFDRLLIAEAMAGNLVLVTNDRAMARYDVQTRWA